MTISNSPSSISLSDWIKNTEASNSRLYAILASTNGATGLKAYYSLDGKHTPKGLYAGTPYATWYPVMPMLVELSPYSAFLSWVQNNTTPGWGWLARSSEPESLIIKHLAGLTQVLMPSGQTVFFRYWDERYFRLHLEFLGEAWRSVLPVFSDYWVDRRAFRSEPYPELPPRDSPWWSVPQPLINNMLAENPAPLVHNLLQMLRENHPDIYHAVPVALLQQKAQQLCRYGDVHVGQGPQLMARLLAAMKNTLPPHKN